jgi:uncharacterized protein (DUF58 family)
VIQQVVDYLTTHVFLLCAIMAIPLAVLAWKRIFPHTPLLLMLLLPCVGSLTLLLVPEALPMIMLIDAIILVMAFGDAIMLPKHSLFGVERTVQRVASLGKSHRVTLRLSYRGATPISIVVRDDLPDTFEPTPEEFAFRLTERSRAEMHYEFKPRQRGGFVLHAVHVRVRSRWGLWKRYLSLPCASTIHVYPDMKQLSEYAVLARTNRLSLMGVRRSRKVGQDHDFERLRDYSLDDNYKHIDWRATARRNKLTVKDFQTSQSQRIIFLMDCGRMMNNVAAGLSLLDHSLNAMLMLSYIALSKGDSVGLVCFSDRVHTYVPPRGGLGQMNHLLHASFDRFPRLVESRYDTAFMHLASNCRKRSLVVLITNIIDEVNSHQVEQYLTAQVGRHLPLGVMLRDHGMFQAVENPPSYGKGLYRAAAAAQIINWRHQVLTDLQHKGVLSLDVFPEDMTAPLINRYLDIKARHLL